MRNVQGFERFIGRDKELNIFSKWLTNDRVSRVLYFHDALEEKDKKGGIGKTWLLNKCREIALQQHPEIAIASIDFFNATNRNGVIVAERIIESLRSSFPDWVPMSFLETMEKYRNIHNKLDLTDDIVKVHRALFEAIAYDLQYLDQQLVKGPKALLVFYDTYESIEQNHAIASLQFSQKFPNTYQFEHMYMVMAGRNALDWTNLNWKGREQEVQTVALTSFSQTEMVQWIDTESSYETEIHSQQTKILYERTGGRPVLINLVANILNRHITTLEQLTTISLPEFESRLVSQINNLEHPLNWIILFMAHAYHHFDLELLNWLLQEANLRHLIQEVQFPELIEDLLTLSFIRKSEAGQCFVLHDEMCRLVNKYCWPTHDKDLTYRNAISHRVIEYYEHAMAKEFSQQKLQAYRIEILFHRLFLDVDDGFAYIQRHFDNAINLWQCSFARTILQVIQQFEHDMSSDQRNRLQLRLATLLIAEDNPNEALNIYEALEDEADEQWVARHRLQLLRGKERCYFASGHFFKIGESRLSLDQRGYICRRLGHFNEALRFYEESISIHRHLPNMPAYANALNNSSNILRLQGNVDEALRRCRLALSIRKDLYRNDQISEIPVGLTLSTMGQIYLDIDNLVSAEQVFQQAYEIYHHAQCKKFIVATMNRFGQVALTIRNLEIARDWFEQVLEVSADIDSDIYINGLNGLGCVLVEQNRWAEAVAFFEQAVDITRRVQDDYQLTESLVYLAEALAHMDQHQRAQQLLQEAEQISLKWSYFHLLGYAAEFQGDMDYAANRYEDAFVHYRKYCYYMAHRNTLDYRKALRKLTDQFLEIPVGQFYFIIDLLITYWKLQKMDEVYPDFIDACNEIKVLCPIDLHRSDLHP